MTPIPYIIQGKNIVLVVNHKPYTITESHISYDKIKEAIKVQDWESVSTLVEATTALAEYTDGEFEIKGGAFYRDGEPIHGVIGDRIVSMFKEGFDIKPMINFIVNLSENPSSRSVNELYGFLERSNLPITPDGHFLAYKKVRENYYDVYSGTVLNKPAELLDDEDVDLPYTTQNASKVTVDLVDGITTISMPRNKVNDDKDQTCSYGLHFCSYDYLTYFGGSRIVVLKINPKDVVSIPSDYDQTKGRACAYQVIDEIENIELAKTYFDSSVYEDDEELEDDEDSGFTYGSFRDYT